MPHAYTEDQLVEQPANALFAELGWTSVSALEETFGATRTLLRETKGELVLVSRLRTRLELLNPALPPEAITTAVDELTHDRSAMSLEAATNVRGSAESFRRESTRRKRMACPASLGLMYCG
jgi:type I restriction enzyme, R subunit